MKREGKSASSMSEIGLCSEHFHAQVQWYVMCMSSFWVFRSWMPMHAHAIWLVFLPRQDGGCERGSHNFSLFALFALFGLVVILGLYLVVGRWLCWLILVAACCENDGCVWNTKFHCLRPHPKRCRKLSRRHNCWRPLSDSTEVRRDKPSTMYQRTWFRYVYNIYMYIYHFAAWQNNTFKIGSGKNISENLCGSSLLILLQS